MEDQRQVKTEDGNQLSEDLEMDYFVESSAKSGLNAEKIFVKAAKLLFKEYELLKNLKERPEEINKKLNDINKNDQKKINVVNI